MAVTVPMGPEHIECWSAPHLRQDVGLSDALWLEIKNQRARIESQTIGSYLPQDLDYDCNGTVSFTKGCYTGQRLWPGFTIGARPSGACTGPKLLSLSSPEIL